MKIINTENGVKKAYVQINDIFTFQEFDEGVPLYVYDAVINNEASSVDRNHGMNFLEFNKPEEVAFFERTDWIIDFKKFKYASIKQIQEEKDRLQAESDEIYNTVVKLSMEERKNKKQEITRIYLINYMRRYLDTLIDYKKGKMNINIPLAPDSDSFAFSKDRSFPYELKPAIDADKVLVYRKDGQPLGENEEIPEDFINKGMSIIMAFRRSIYKEEDFETTSYRSGDNIYYVIEFVKKKKKLEEAKEEKGIMRLVHKLINKKN